MSILIKICQQDNRLLYFHSETSTDPVGFIPLTQIVRFPLPSNLFHFLHVIFYHHSFLFAQFLPFPSSSIGSSTHAAHASNRSVFEIKTTQRYYYLLAECEEDKETWIAGLTNSMTYWKVSFFLLSFLKRAY